MMKKRILIVGAPSLSGGGVAHILAERLSQDLFPMSVEVTNNMPFPVAFPEIGPILLQQAADLENCKAVVDITSIPAFVRLATNIEALAEHHQFPEAMYFRLPEVEEEEPAVSAAEPVADDPPADAVQSTGDLPPDSGQGNGATDSGETGAGEIPNLDLFDSENTPPPDSSNEGKTPAEEGTAVDGAGADAGGPAVGEETPPKRAGRPRKNKDAD